MAFHLHYLNTPDLRAPVSRMVLYAGTLAESSRGQKYGVGPHLTG